jgi:glucose/arabinose dehydrogenase
MKLLPVSIAASLLCSASVLTQQAPGLTTITGHVAKAERLEATDSRAKLVVPAGFEVSTFASGLGKPRVLAVADDGTVYATRRDTGDVIMLRAHDRDGRADAPVIVARRPQMHGIALNANKVYLVTVKELFVADRRADGTFGPSNV